MLSRISASVARSAFGVASRATHSRANFSNMSHGEAKHVLVLLRHGESEWNKANKFTGWVDVPLSESGMAEAEQAGMLLRDGGYKFDVAFTSVLKRAIKTLWITLETTDQMWIPVHRTWRLNERHYGGLTGLDKAETVAKHGAEQVLVWRRSYDIPPPEMAADHEHSMTDDRRYAEVPADVLPRTESLKTTGERVLPAWNETIAPAIRSGKRVLIAAHGNSLRALVKYLDNISEEEIVHLNIPTGVPLVYHLDAELRPVRSPRAMAPLSGEYLGDPEAVAMRVSAVANQTKGK